ncbi:surface antigen-like protein [Angomonas deanei]|nr:surface antigen-like protein [Angomonas deanei]|eukprot:EPY17414.1 surface antigen-like protein [Angomonas deanei]
MTYPARRSALRILFTGLLLIGSATAANDSNAYIANLLTSMGISGINEGNVCSASGIRCANGFVSEIMLHAIDRFSAAPRTLPDHTVAPFNTYHYDEMTIATIECSNFPSLTGSLPAAWGRIKTLYYLRLADSQLTGSLPKEWSAMTALITLYLANNQLSGTLPPEWTSLKIRSLDLSSNQLTGALPLGWGSLSLLVNLKLSNNGLTGALPPEWSYMRELLTLDVSNNQLGGTLPQEWSGITALETLRLGKNQLIGSFPASWSTLPALQVLELNDNQLSGNVPDRLPPRIQSVDFRGNRLSGCFPQSFTTATYPSAKGIYLPEEVSGCVPPSWKEPKNGLYNCYSDLLKSYSSSTLDDCASDSSCSVDAAKPEKKGLSAGAIAGIVVACVVVFLVILFLIIFLCCCRKNKKDAGKLVLSTETPGTMNPLVVGSSEDDRSCSQGRTESMYSHYNDVH